MYSLPVIVMYLSQYLLLCYPIDVTEPGHKKSYIYFGYLYY